MAVKPLKVLVLEDRVEDLELLLHTLKKADFDPIWRRVETESEFRSAVAQDWDVILADFNLPGFTAPGAMEILRQQGIDTPFLVITGSISEEVAVECLKKGAADYLLKDRLARLGTAVEQALQHRDALRQERKHEAALRESEERFRQLAQAAFEGLMFHEHGMILDANQVFAEMFGFKTVEELIGKDLFAVLPLTPESRATIRKRTRLPKTGVFEIVALLPDGSSRTIETQGRGYVYQGRQARAVAVQDVTERKRTEKLLLESEKLRTV
ncbi:MAG: PAS domain S-box protein, partial [Tepidisphaerales bacterium]